MGVERHARKTAHDPPDAAPSRPKPLIENQNFAEGLLGPVGIGFLFLDAGDPAELVERA
jgi:hypothetical protein